ncbi:chromogranin-A isoform X2 [Dunckerocampus dactyliophorus]|uniref:chromogranin-A isoform X2 n=1 Tax=Dunckerocampus dactyliophorus TaxID=161453 RepID=UPI002405B4FC|nr:chromogranin-A isoform X2 [Dunckerocampus dactyliophorus]
MIALLTVTLLTKCVLSLPVTPSVLENDDDVKVMKCVVEALADVLARPRPLPVSQKCLQTLRTDERLLSLLRHYDFLKELQDIATLGGKEGARPQGGAIAPDHVKQAPLSSEGDIPDRSMLDALGGPGERSTLYQKSRTSGEEEEEEEEQKKASGSEEKTATEFHAEDEEEDKRSAVFSQRSREDESEEEENEDEMKRSRKKSLGAGEEEQKEPHHSKEAAEEEEVTKRKEKLKEERTPEEKELQMMARRGPEEEGSAGRKTEDAEVEGLSAIESELEDVAQKLHELRRG